MLSKREAAETADHDFAVFFKSVANAADQRIDGFFRFFLSQPQTFEMRFENFPAPALHPLYAFRPDGPREERNDRAPDALASINDVVNFADNGNFDTGDPRQPHGGF